MSSSHEAYPNDLRFVDMEITAASSPTPQMRSQSLKARSGKGSAESLQLPLKHPRQRAKIAPVPDSSSEAHSVDNDDDQPAVEKYMTSSNRGRAIERKCIAARKCRKKERKKAYSLQPETASATLESAQQKRQKRSYRHHPRRDPNAPVRPTTGYVMFSNACRSDSETSHIQFVEMAKRVGHLWQDLGLGGRDVWINRAATRMAEYQKQYEVYKTSDDHTQYQSYLKDFRSKQKEKGRAADGTDEEEAISAKLRDVDVPDRVNVLNTFKGLIQSIRVGSNPQLSFVSWEQSNAHVDRQECQYALGKAMEELDVLCKISHVGITYYDENNPPQLELIIPAVTAFYAGIGAIFFLYTDDDITAILNHVYNRQTMLDNSAVLDLLAIVAIGSAYDCDAPATDLQYSCYHSCIRLLRNSGGRDDLRSMRLFLCLSLYCTLESPESARVFIKAALQIGRAKAIPRNESAEDRIYWRKIYQTVVLTECW
jgi:hypothetical protein